jgi:hypothetical protein
MTQDKPTITVEAVEHLRASAKDPGALTQAATAKLWHALLQQRLDWLQQWDAALAPVLAAAPARNAARAEFPLKSQQVTDLLDAWGRGLSGAIDNTPPNSAALMLMGFAGKPNLLEAARHWAAGLRASEHGEQPKAVIEQGLSLVNWFRHWGGGREPAELALLEALNTVAVLPPEDQQQLAKLKTEHWKAQRMQVAAGRPCVAWRERADAQALERYFKEKPEAARTLLALRVKSVSPQNELLKVPSNWSVDGFFATLEQQSRHHTVLADGYELHRYPITLTDAHGGEDCEAALYQYKPTTLALLLTVAERGGFADIRVATLVLAGDMSLDAYRDRVIQVQDSGESSEERRGRSAITEVVQTALQAFQRVQQPAPGQVAG